MKCYNKVLSTISEKSLSLPAYKYVNIMFEKFEEYTYMFNYRLQYNRDPTEKVEECKPSGLCLSSVKTKQKSQQFKFDLGFGKLIFDVSYITLKSLVQINDYFDLIKNVSIKKSPQEEKQLNDGRFIAEYFSENAESMNSSHSSPYEIDHDESDEFVLITTSANYGEAPSNQQVENFNSKLISPRSQEKGLEDEEAKIEKRHGDDDDYKFDAEVRIIELHVFIGFILKQSASTEQIQVVV